MLSYRFLVLVESYRDAGSAVAVGCRSRLFLVVQALL